MSLSVTTATVVSDVKRALDQVFSPLQIKMNEDSCAITGESCIDYVPPFYLDQKCNEMSFGCWYKGEPSYPLTCTAFGELGEDETFTVQNADDWINHAPKFVRWYDECVELMDKIAARKK